MPNADTRSLTYVVAGALAMGYAVAALFFARFRRRTGQRLFSWFATAFALLAVQRLALVVVVGDPASVVWLHGLRLAAFVLLLAGIAAQNRSAVRSGGA